MARRNRISALLLQTESSAALDLRRMASENLEDSPPVMVSAVLEPFDTVVHWQAEQAAAQS
jgi:hypothetical protein